MKKSSSFTFRTFVFLAILLSGCTSTSTPSNTVNISSDGKGDFATLEEAIEAVPPNTAIVLGEGQFELSDSLVIEKSLTIQGSGSNLTTIVNSSGGSPVIFFQGEQLTITGISIQRTGEFASNIMVINKGEVYLENCNLSGGGASEDNSVQGDGLLIAGKSNVTMKNCIIENNMGVGIFVGDSAKLTVEQISSSNNKYGIVFIGNSVGNIQNSTFSDNQSNGIFVTESANVNILGNTINNNVGPGINFKMDRANGEVRNNNLARNDLGRLGTDIMISRENAPALIENTCDGKGKSPVVWGGDHNGIVFMGEGNSLPTNPILEGNSCMIAMCSGQSLLSLSCE